MDTIFALTTARGKSGVAIIRISGPQARDITVLCKSLPASHEVRLRSITTATGGAIDQGMVAYFAAPNSFTGEDVVELHLHGSNAVIKAVFSALAQIKNYRMADPGEFTRRALENGRLDLAQVEGLADLIDAETEAQRKQALRVLSGALGERASTWRVDLIRAAALLEATIDFADEDVPVDVTPEVRTLITSVQTDLKTESAGTIIAERIRDGFEVAIVGAPNVGKSTLLNALAGREAAITSEHAGTTRDVIEVRMDLNGLPVTILDTAGLRDTGDAVEIIGIQRAIQRAKDADLRIFLIESEQPLEWIKPVKHDIIVEAKADLSGKGVSGKTGQGIDDLIQQISAILETRASGAQVAIRERHRVALDRAIIALDLALSEIETGLDRSELAAEDLRTAIRALDMLIGRVDVEDLLDEIFSSFCLGK